MSYPKILTQTLDPGYTIKSPINRHSDDLFTQCCMNGLWLCYSGGRSLPFQAISHLFMHVPCCCISFIHNMMLGLDGRPVCKICCRSSCYVCLALLAESRWVPRGTYWPKRSTYSSRYPPPYSTSSSPKTRYRYIPIYIGSASFHLAALRDTNDDNGKDTIYVLVVGR